MVDTDGHIHPADLDDRSQSQYRLYQENGPLTTLSRIKKKWVIFPVYRSIYLSLKSKNLRPRIPFNRPASPTRQAFEAHTERSPAAGQKVEESSAITDGPCTERRSPSDESRCHLKRKQIRCVCQNHRDDPSSAGPSR